MLQRLFLAVCLLWVFGARAQYKNDNVLYKTVDFKDLCSELQKSNGYLLLDVRSQGEHDDTSAYLQLNIGHLKGAKNINIRELGNRLSEINVYKTQPVFVYCSHSQRSRRASRLLADSGFANVFNINGGMTALYYENGKNIECLKSILVSKNKYNIISPTDLTGVLERRKNDVFLLDVRSDSFFHHISHDAKANAYGIIRGSVNIPLNDLGTRLSAVPRDKEIIVLDLYGGEAAKAAAMLKGKGFERVSMLIEGIDRWLSSDKPDAGIKREWYVPSVNYSLINTPSLVQFNVESKDWLLLDIRTQDEFNNKSKDNWRNIGHIKNAINIPARDLPNRLAEIEAYKPRKILLYSFSGNADLYDAADLLLKQGYTQISVLTSGLFDIRWTAANKKNFSSLNNLVTDVPDENK